MGLAKANTVQALHPQCCMALSFLSLRAHTKACGSLCRGMRVNMNLAIKLGSSQGQSALNLPLCGCMLWQVRCRVSCNVRLRLSVPASNAT